MGNVKITKELKTVERAAILTVIAAIIITVLVFALKPAPVYADAKTQNNQKEASDDIVIELLAELPDGTEYESQYTVEIP